MKNDLPVISFKTLSEPSTLSTLDHACREWGFFQLVDHGIASDEISEIKEQMYRFFAQSTEAKQAVERTELNPWGFYGEERTKNKLDWKEVFDYGPAVVTPSGLALQPQWPASMSDFRHAVLSYYERCYRISIGLIEAIAVNLGASPQGLNSHFAGNHSSFLRLNYYPRCPLPETPDGASEPESGFLGLNRHTDAGALTLLLQDGRPGLEVFNKGQWCLVPPMSNALTINIGDVVQVWSNDEYRAAIHRVVAHPFEERFSIPFFFNPRYDVNYEPLPTMVTPASPQRYQTINWGEFRAARAAGDYADLGEEIQISHYRIETGAPHGIH